MITIKKQVNLEVNLTVDYDNAYVDFENWKLKCMC